MAGIKLQKRDDDFFVSYGHGDVARVAALVGLLKRECGLRIWFDGADGNASLRSSELLGNAIGNARGAIFCLSEAWKSSSWCKDEYDASLVERRGDSGFEIVSVKLDEVDPPNWFKVAEIIDLRRDGSAAVANLLRSLASDKPHRLDNVEDVYLAAPWSRPSKLASEAFQTLSGVGWRLIGDSPTFKHLGERRIEAIQRTARGVVALMPYDPAQAGTTTSRYILQEAELALKLGKPLLLLAEPGVTAPEEVVRGAFRGTAIPLAAGPAGREALAGVLDEFDESLRHVTHDDTNAFIFFAASLRDDRSETDNIASVVERASNMPCVRGERLSGDHVQRAIVELIGRAAMVIADVSDDHRNTLIEAGIALGSRTQLRLMCREPPGGVPPKKRFMFEDREVLLYRTPEERLALCYRFAREFRRKVYVLR